MNLLISSPRLIFLAAAVAAGAAIAAPVPEREADDVQPNRGAGPAENAAQVPPGSPRPAAPPVLRLEPLGPRAAVTAVAFSPDGETLYAAGADKVVHVWRLRRQGDDPSVGPGPFVFLPERTLRIPIGPGDLGLINALAVSPDGEWLAVGGVGVHRNFAGFDTGGIYVSSSQLSTADLGDRGAAFLFHLPTGRQSRIRAHHGRLYSLTFAAGAGPPLLVTTGQEQLPGQPVGTSMRVWEAESGRQVASTVVPPPVADPQMAAVRLGSGGVRVTLTSGDDKLRTWDSTGGPVGEADFRACSACGGTADGSAAIVAGWKRLEFRSASAPPSSVPLPPYEVPRSATLLNYEGRRLAAVAFEDDRNPRSFGLDVIDLQTGASQMSAPVPLGRGNNPVAAADPRGRFVAVTLPGRVEVRVFETGRLLAGEQSPAQSLVPAGVDLAGVTFARNGERSGLLVSAAGQRGGAIAFDLDRGDISAADGWRPEEPAGPWDAQVAPLGPGRAGATRYSIRVTRPEGGATTVETESWRPPIVAAGPGGDGHPAAIAVATYVSLAPRLEIFDTTSGVRLRRLAGHTDVIRSLAFSPDGRLLATAAADRSVCLWWMPDLSEVAGRRGQLTGVDFIREGDSVKVAGFTEGAGAEARGALRAGDTVLGFVEAGAFKPIASRSDLAYGLSLRPPGSRVQLRVASEGGERDVSVTLSQAIDERKPLFSLFLDRDAAADRWSWIGWAPQGPFESSDRQVERFVGWHFNPADRAAGGPVRFAGLAEYRDAFFGRGLIPALIKTGEIPTPWPPAADPTAVLMIRDQGGKIARPDAEGRVPVQAPADLRVVLAGAAPEAVTSATWTLTGQEPRPLRRSPDPEVWTADLSAIPWPEGVHRVRVEFATRRPGGSSVVSAETLLSVQAAPQPKPPVVAAKLRVEFRPSPVVFDDVHPAESELVIDAAIDRDGRQVTGVVLVAGPNDKDEGASFPAQINGDRLVARVPLRPGRNAVRVRISDGAGAEVTTPPAEVNYARPPVVLDLKGEAETGGAFATLFASVRSPDRLADRVSLTVNGSLVEAKQFSVQPVADRPGLWSVTVAGVPLAAESNEIAASFANADGTSRAAAKLALRRPAAPPKPPTIAFPEYPANGIVSSREYDLAVEIRAPRPLASAEIRVQGEAENLAAGTPDATGTYRIRRRVTLLPGANSISVSAVTADGGHASAETTLSVVETPVNVVIESLAAGGRELAGKKVGDKTNFAVAPVAEAKLRGRIVIPDDRPNPGPVHVRGWVNGFLQVVREATRQEDGGYRFELPIVLSHAKANNVRIDVPVLAEQGQAVCEADCDKPMNRQRLHFILIGVGIPDDNAAAFSTQTRAALRIPGESSDAFAEIQAYEPLLVGSYVEGAVIRERLYEYQARTAEEDGGVNEVLLVYFVGKEGVTQGGGFALEASDHLFDPSSAVTSDFLTEILSDARGAHLLFLDVMNPDVTRRPGGWPRQVGLGVLRSVWQGIGQVPQELALAVRLQGVQEDRLKPIADAISSAQPAGKPIAYEAQIPAEMRELLLGAR